MGIEAWRSRIFGVYYYFGCFLFMVFKSKIFESKCGGIVRIFFVLVMCLPMIVRIILVGMILTQVDVSFLRDNNRLK